jgi:hypothetical protein
MKQHKTVLIALLIAFIAYTYLWDNFIYPQAVSMKLMAA